MSLRPLRFVLMVMIIGVVVSSLNNALLVNFVVRVRGWFGYIAQPRWSALSNDNGGKEVIEFVVDRIADSVENVLGPT